MDTEKQTSCYILMIPITISIISILKSMWKKKNKNKKKIDYNN